MYLTYKDGLKFLGILIFCVEVAMITMLSIQGGFIPTSSGNATHQEHSEFALKVAANGETVYTAAENVSRATRKVIVQEVYPSPEAAVEAVEGPLPGNPALAHAVSVCTHSDGKVSNQTGGGRHLTWFVKHENGRHYTKTAHQVLTINGYQTTDVYAYDVSRTYCGCN